MWVHLRDRRGYNLKFVVSYSFTKPVDINTSAGLELTFANGEKVGIFNEDADRIYRLLTQFT